MVNTLRIFPVLFIFRLTGLSKRIIFWLCSLRLRIDTPSGVDRPRRGSVVHRSPPQPVPPPRPFYAHFWINAVIVILLGEPLEIFYSPRIWTMIFLLRGPSNSQKKIPCHVPSCNDPPLIRICSLQPIRELLQCESEFPSECR